MTSTRTALVLLFAVLLLPGLAAQQVDDPRLYGEIAQVDDELSLDVRASEALTWALAKQAFADRGVVAPESAAPAPGWNAIGDVWIAVERLPFKPGLWSRVRLRLEVPHADAQLDLAIGVLQGIARGLVERVEGIAADAGIPTEQVTQAQVEGAAGVGVATAAPATTIVVVDDGPDLVSVVPYPYEWPVGFSIPGCVSYYGWPRFQYSFKFGYGSTSLAYSTVKYGYGFGPQCYGYGFGCGFGYCTCSGYYGYGYGYPSFSYGYGYGWPNCGIAFVNYGGWVFYDDPWDDDPWDDDDWDDDDVVDDGGGTDDDVADGGDGPTGPTHTREDVLAIREGAADVDADVDGLGRRAAPGADRGASSVAHDDDVGGLGRTVPTTTGTLVKADADGRRSVRLYPIDADGAVLVGPDGEDIALPSVRRKTVQLHPTVATIDGRAFGDRDGATGTVVLRGGSTRGGSTRDGLGHDDVGTRGGGIASGERRSTTLLAGGEHNVFAPTPRLAIGSMMQGGTSTTPTTTAVLSGGSAPTTTTISSSTGTAVIRTSPSSSSGVVARTDPSTGSTTVIRTTPTTVYPTSPSTTPVYRTSPTTTSVYRPSTTTSRTTSTRTTTTSRPSYPTSTIRTTPSRTSIPTSTRSISTPSRPSSVSRPSSSPSRSSSSASRSSSSSSSRSSSSSSRGSSRGGRGG